jgi:hypothetical protein
MNTRLFVNKKLSNYDIISAIIYTTITGIISYGGLLFNDYELYKKVVLAYSFGTPLLLYGLQYKSLRNIRNFIIWIAFGLYHIFLYNKLIEVNYLQYVRGHAAHGLQYTIYFVFLFQVLRFFHLKITGKELVSLGGYGATTDIYDDTKIGVSDIICFFIYFPAWILVTTAF